MAGASGTLEGAPRCVITCGETGGGGWTTYASEDRAAGVGWVSVAIWASDAAMNLARALHCSGDPTCGLAFRTWLNVPSRSESKLSSRVLGASRTGVSPCMVSTARVWPLKAFSVGAGQQLAPSPHHHPYPLQPEHTRNQTRLDQPRPDSQEVSQNVNHESSQQASRKASSD